MSEYSRRIFTFSAIAVILAIGLSVSITFLPSMMATSSLTTQESQPMTSTPSVVTSTLSSTATVTGPTTGSVYSATSTITSETIISATQRTSVTATSVKTITSGTVVYSSTAPCGSPGVYCGSASVSSVSLKVGNDSSTLQFTLTEIGNDYIGSATVYVNGTVIGTPPASEYEPPGNIKLNIQPNQSAVLVLVIPSSSITINVGASYSIIVYTWLGAPGQPANSGLPAAGNVSAT